MPSAAGTHIGRPWSLITRLEFLGPRRHRDDEVAGLNDRADLANLPFVFY